MDINLKHKTAIVCGSTQGIGLATAKELAKLGANIILIARNPERLESTMKALDTSADQSHGFIVADFTQPEELKNMLDISLGNKSVEILVNNTGGPAGGFPEAAEALQVALRRHRRGCQCEFHRACRDRRRCIQSA